MEAHADLDHGTTFLTPATITSLSLLSFGWFLVRPTGLHSSLDMLLPALLIGACSIWLGLVSKAVPEPYLDEVFHIPQAQKYCEGRFREWDDKITTPPGLYLLSVVVPRGLSFASFEGALCDARSLRAVSAISLFVLSYLSLLCRQKIESRLYGKHFSKKVAVRSQYASHTAINIALFPLLFFFSGLYYTDVVSTTTVILAFLNHLSRLERQTSSIVSDVTTVVLGLSTLFMRQTNVFWVVVYMGGLEAVYAIKTLHPKAATRPTDPRLWAQIQYSLSRYSVGAIHDPPLNQAWPDDALFTILSLAIGGICNPISVLRQIWPYITVLGAFAGFVIWNGSVVLGDKSNHVATLHLAQMLYIWPFFAFFSLPLVLPSVLPGLGWVYQSLLGKRADAVSRSPPSTSAPKSLRTAHTVDLLHASKQALWLVYILATTLISFAVVRYNTIIHPFTLADNRHYMFYIFRYTIRRATWIRYFLILPYTLSRWLVWATFAGCYGEAYGLTARPHCSIFVDEPSGAPFDNYPVWQPTEETAGSKNSTQPKTEAKARQGLEKTSSDAQVPQTTEPVSTSTAIIFLVATALSLVTAPLVEPRYFIIPWVMWRLLLPAWRPHSHGEWEQGVASQTALGGGVGRLLQRFQEYDIRLIFETIWFMAINLATGYIFLAKPYQWKAADGSLLDDGRWQRFMW